MYYLESEHCASEYPILLDIIEKIDEIIYQSSSSSNFLFDINSLSIKLKKNESHLRTIFEFLVSSDLLCKEEYYLCPNCQNLINVSEILNKIELGEFFECSQCDEELSKLKLKNVIRYRIKKELSKNNQNRDFIKNTNLETNTENNYISDESELHILHISDMHLIDQSQSEKLFTQLRLDLKRELSIDKLSYVIVSGDIGNKSTETEYNAALSFFNKLSNDFCVKNEKIMIVPGNHDLNWDLSKQSFYFEESESFNPDLKKCYKVEGGYSVLIPDSESKKFYNFNKFLYFPIYHDNYPVDFSFQTKTIEDEENMVVIIGFNSAWNINHIGRKDASINNDTLNHVICQYSEKKYDNWLKMCVWHHPVSGEEMMNDHFLEQLIVAGFQICFHGHIHEATNVRFFYDTTRNLKIIGAGSFGAQASSQPQGIPHQYNLIKILKNEKKVIVHTRKKEHPNGAWSADSRWNDKNNPSSSYQFNY